MARYFMGDTRLEGLERMMMDASRKPPANTYPQGKMTQKKPPRSRPVDRRPRERERKGRGV